MQPSPDSILVVTLDSCRYDTFESADAPAMKAVSRLYKAQAPSHFTYGSHAAMFVGMTPGVPGLKQRFLDPKFGRLFRLRGPNVPVFAEPGFEVDGIDVVRGLANAGYRTIGTGAVTWFSDKTRVSRNLTRGFDRYFFAGRRGVTHQVDWLRSEIEEAGTTPVFAFMNVGETHVPYWFPGAPWPRGDNTCLPFQRVDRAEECRLRQRLCCEYIDRQIAGLLEAFSHATIMLCADHGDCWGEDGLWEHSISHPMTLTVPLLIRYRGQPVEALKG